jgi:hypothetical protein
MKTKVSLIIIGLISSLISVVGISSANAECSAADPCGTWAMLDPQGTVTNIIVCQASVCGSGTWAGQTVVPQVAPNPVTNDTTGVGGYWGTYDSNTREFTVDRSGPNQTPEQTQINTETSIETNSEGAVLSTTIIETTTPSVSKIFKYEDTIKNPNDFDQNGKRINSSDQTFLKDKQPSNNSMASIKLTKKSIQNEMERVRIENMSLLSRITEEELSETAIADNKTLIIENIVSVVRLLNSWIKTIIK